MAARSGEISQGHSAACAVFAHRIHFRVDHTLITASERGHDGVPALAQGITAGSLAILRRSSGCSISHKRAEANRAGSSAASTRMPVDPD